MKHIKKIIDFNKFEIDDELKTSGGKIIKEIYPVFYNFLVENDLVEKWVLSLKKCGWSFETNDIRTILKKYNHNKTIISNSLNWSCSDKLLHIDWSPINWKFREYHKKYYL
jgi:hypothetical protein